MYIAVLNRRPYLAGYVNENKRGTFVSSQIMREQFVGIAIYEVQASLLKERCASQFFGCAA